jgi:hypothetical protein
MKTSARSIALSLLCLVLGPAMLLPAPVASLNLSTGFDEAAGVLVGDGLADGDYHVVQPPALQIQATVLPGQYPLYPAGPWDANSATSKWIGLPAGSSMGAPGNYSYLRRLDVPPGIPADRLVLSGFWEVDDVGLDVRVNGTSTGITNTTGFIGPQAFPPHAGLGLFVTGPNDVEFVVLNGGTSANPTGLRVEAALIPELSENCWSGLSPGANYPVGATFTAEGARFTVEPFVLFDGTPYGFGAALVASGEACQTGQELWVRNVNVVIDHGGPLTALTVHYGDRGGNINLTVNGAFANVLDFRDLPSTLGGVAVSVVEFGAPQSCGILTLTGLISSLRLGGMELSVDCLEASPAFRRGDANGDGQVDIADSVHLAEWLFIGGLTLACERACDVDDSGGLNITDPVRALNYLFLGGSVPPLPGPLQCGGDPTHDPLSCDSYSACTPPVQAVQPAVELHLRAPAIVSGPPGSTTGFEAGVDLCWQRPAGNADLDFIRGWSLGVATSGGGKAAIQSATTGGTDAELAATISRFSSNQVLPGGLTLVSGVVLSLKPNLPAPVPLQPTGTGAGCNPESLLRILLTAKVSLRPGECYDESLEFVEGAQGSGAPVPIRVAASGRVNGVAAGGLSLRPVVSPRVTVRICADNTAKGERLQMEAGAGVVVTFEKVTEPGYTGAERTGSGPPPPDGFQVLDGEDGTLAYYSVSTTASYGGLVEVCFPYDPPPGMSEEEQAEAIRLVVHEPGPGEWRDVTASIDTAAHVICARTHLSDFAIVRPSEVLGPRDDPFRRGDPNGSGDLDISDAVSTLLTLFAGGPGFPCPDAADANDDGLINITDALRTLDFLFTDESPPIPAPEVCGSDPTGDDLGPCLAAAPCDPLAG